jgi:hypothetical protein
MSPSRGADAASSRWAISVRKAARRKVLLRHARDTQCTVRMWREQSEKITIAFTGCQKSCEGKAFDYLWPILVESKTGQCS